MYKFFTFVLLIFAALIQTVQSAQAGLVEKTIRQTSRGKVLVVLSGVDFVSLKGGGRHPTGFFLSELTVPAAKILGAGYELVFANPNGRIPAMDKISDDPKWFSSPEEYQTLKRLLTSLKGLRNPRRLASFSEAELNTFAGI